MLFESPEQETKLKEELAKINVQLFTIPAPTGEELHRLQGWRDTLEKEAQYLWSIYHWIVKCQDSNAHGIYTLAQWLEDFNVPDNTEEGTRGEYPARRGW